MKKCPTCEKEFDDAMRFCQTDGTPLVDAAPEVDPYKTMVARSEDIAAMIPPASEAQPQAPAAPEPPPTSEEVLDLPPIGSDPKKTMYASEDEIRSAMAEVDTPIVDVPPVVAEPEPPTFIAPPAAKDLPPRPEFKTTPPIPSPFGEPSPEPELPVFEAPEPEPPAFAQAEPAAPAFNPFEHSAPEPKIPMVGSNFPPSPAAQDQSWQKQEMQNPQYQPGSGMPAAAGQNKTLAIVSLVAGILGLTLCCGTLIPSLVAIVTGFMARGKANSDPSNYGGAGLAIGGLITGVLGLLAGIGYLIFVFFLGGLQLMMQGAR